MDPPLKRLAIPAAGQPKVNYGASTNQLSEWYFRKLLMYCFESLLPKAKEAKIQRLRKNIVTKLSSFFPCYVKLLIHLFLPRRATVQNMRAFSKLEGVDYPEGGANVSHNYLKI